jgi:hypothetical protein
MHGNGMTKAELVQAQNAVNALSELLRICKERIESSGGKVDKLLSLQMRVIHTALLVFNANRDKAGIHYPAKKV